MPRFHRTWRSSISSLRAPRHRPSLEAQQRVAELIAREKEAGLTPEEQSELGHFVDLEHILRMAKGRAQQILTSGS
jgi:hypothetical protein